MQQRKSLQKDVPQQVRSVCSGEGEQGVLIFISVAVPGLSGGTGQLRSSLQLKIFSCMWYLVPRPGIEPRLPVLGAQNLSL